MNTIHNYFFYLRKIESFNKLFLNSQVSYTEKLTSVKCNSNKKYVLNISCTLTPVRKSFGIIRAYAFLKNMTLSDTWVDTTLFYKFGTIYRQYLFHSDVNICKVLHGKNLDIFETMWAQYWKQNLPKVSVCPIQNSFVWITSNKTKSMFFGNYTRMPDGDYKLVNRFHLANNETLFVAELKTTVRSINGVNKMSMLEMG